MKQIGSAITITPEGQPSRIGMPLGGRGLATSENSRVAEWLSRQAPADMDAAAVLRASSHGVTLAVKYELRFPEGPNGERLPSYSVAVSCAASPNGNHADALADLESFMTPAPIRVIEGWLAELSVIIAKRQDDEIAEALRVTAYSSRLAGYPADVVKSALFKKPAWKFWPAWAELEAICDRMAGPRGRMISALRNPPLPAPTRRPPTDDERQRVQALIDEMFPHVTEAWRTRAVDEAMSKITVEAAE